VIVFRSFVTDAKVV